VNRQSSLEGKRLVSHIGAAQNLVMPSNMTWIEVADSAVKIGLGALMTGMFGWFVANHVSKSAMQKMKFERRSKLLEEIADAHEAYFQSFMDFSLCLDGIRALGVKANDPIVKTIGAEPTPLLRKMSEKSNDIIFAQSRLMLLGETECERRARELHKAIVDSFQQLKWDGVTFDLSHLPEMSRVIREAREAFYKEMRVAFDKV